MQERADSKNEIALLVRAGLAKWEVSSFLKTSPHVEGGFKRDTAAFSKFWRAGAALRKKLPAKPARDESQAAACALILAAERKARDDFMAAHCEKVYRRLTDDYRRFVRAEALIYDAADLVPGLVPAMEDVERENTQPLKGKDGVEVDQGIFLAHVAANRDAGRHLCHAMLLPLPETQEKLKHLVKRGSIDLGATYVERRGRATIVELRHPRFLNAVDDLTMRADGARDRSRHSRSGDGDRGPARRLCRASEICRAASVLLRHQSHPSLSGQDFISVLRQSCAGL